VSICILVSLATTSIADGMANYYGQLEPANRLEDGKYYYYYGGQFYEINEANLLFILQTQQQTQQQQPQQGYSYPTPVPTEVPWVTPAPTQYTGQWQQQTQYGYNYVYAIRKDVKVYNDTNCKNSVASLSFGQAVQITWRQQGQNVIGVQLVDGTGISGYVKIADVCKPLYKLNLKDMVFFGTTINFSVKSYGSAVGGYRNNEEALVLYEEGDYYFVVADSGCSGWIRKNSGAIEIVESCQYEAVNTWYWSTYKDYYTSNQWNSGNFVVARPSLSLFTKPNQASKKIGTVKFLEQPEIIEDNGEWLYVRKSDGNEGYIRKVYFCESRGTISVKASVYLAPFPGMNKTDFAANAGGLAKKNETCLIISDWGNYYHVVTASGKVGYIEKSNVK